MFQWPFFPLSNFHIHFYAFRTWSSFQPMTFNIKADIFFFDLPHMESQAVFTAQGTSHPSHWPDVNPSFDEGYSWLVETCLLKVQRFQTFESPNMAIQDHWWLRTCPIFSLFKLISNWYQTDPQSPSYRFKPFRTQLKPNRFFNSTKPYGWHKA